MKERIFALLIILSTFYACSKRSSLLPMDMAVYFSHFPPLVETSQIFFGQDDLRPYLLEGWALPKTDSGQKFVWAVGAKSTLRCFLSEKMDYTMHLHCRTRMPFQMEVLVNGNSISSLKLEEGKNDVSVELPQSFLQAGLNMITFVYSPVDMDTRKRARIAFQQLEFAPLKHGIFPEIRLDAEQQLVFLQGPLHNSFYMRTYLGSKFAFQHRSSGKMDPDGKISLQIENFLGQRIMSEISLSSKTWKKERLDLASFPNQVVKLTIQHLVGRELQTVIKRPILEPGSVLPSKRKILMFGLDGATWGIIHPLIESGYLPNLKKLIESGTTGRLLTVRPIYSPLVWTSIMTGKTKKKHGITGFVNQQRRKGDIIPNSSLNRECLALWNILSHQDYVVGLVGPWVTWPAEPVNGYMLSDRMYFENLSAVTFPSDLKRTLYFDVKPRLDQKENPYFKEMERMLSVDSQTLRSSLQKNIQQGKMYIQQDDLKREAGLFLNQTFFPDFFFLYMRGPDVFSHFFWKYFDPDETVPGKEIPLFKDIVLYNYYYQDTVLGEYLNNIASDTNIIVVSDHGMARKSYSLDIGFERIERLWESMDISKRLLRSTFSRHKITLELKQNVSLANTKDALAGIKLSDQDTALFEVKQNQAANSLELEVKEIYRLDGNAEVYFNEKRLGIVDDFLSLRETSGNHTLHGILIMAGPDIKNNIQLKECSVLDITPTILYMLGLPVGEDMDGAVLKEAFTKRYLQKNPVQYIKSYEGMNRIQDQKSNGINRDKEVEKELLERLRTLGYIK